MLSTIASTATALAAHPGFGPWVGFGPGPFLIFPIVFGVLIIGLIVTLIVTRRRRWHHAGWGGPWGGPWAAAQGVRSAESVLAERFARGDIDETEYRARLEVLRAQPPLPSQR